jgi:hypothetical protein
MAKGAPLSIIEACGSIVLVIIAMFGHVAWPKDAALVIIATILLADICWRSPWTREVDSSLKILVILSVAMLMCVVTLSSLWTAYASRSGAG